MRIKSINLLALLTIPLSIYLVVSGIVDWEIVCLIWLMELELNVKIKYMILK